MSGQVAGREFHSIFCPEEETPAGPRLEASGRNQTKLAFRSIVKLAVLAFFTMKERRQQII